MSVSVEHDKRREEILDKALDVFVREGYKDTTFQKIAERCGITRTILYLYFDNIAETRAALLERGHAPSEIKYPFYMPGGECRLEDPDGYVLMLAQI